MGICSSRQQKQSQPAAIDSVLSAPDPVATLSARRESSRVAPAISRRSGKSLADQPASFADTYQIVWPMMPIGRGSAGTVVQRCVHRQTSRPCAVKTIDKSLIRRGDDRIAREIELLKQLNHPNIIRMHDTYEDKSEARIVTELCRGGDLLDKIVSLKRKNNMHRIEEEKESSDNGGIENLEPCFRETDAKCIIRQVLLAVSYLHSVGVVHRDIKPENVLFVENGDNDSNKQSNVKLADFGLATRHDPSDAPLSSKVGTLFYMAPELLEGSYGRACDLWSVGVVAYTMLSGKMPFSGADDDSIARKIRMGQYWLDSGSAFAGASYDVKDFIRELMKMDPRRRATADTALVHPWLSPASL